MSKFSALKTDRARTIPAPQPEAVADANPHIAERKPGPRDGKRAVSGYFSPSVSQGLNILAREQSVTLQALLGEAFDDIMRKYGKHPFGER